MKNLKLAIDQESVTIYIDNGENEEHILICYWHMEEWEEDPSIVVSIANAIQLFYTNKKELLSRLDAIKTI